MKRLTTSVSALPVCPLPPCLLMYHLPAHRIHQVLTRRMHQRGDQNCRHLSLPPTFLRSVLRCVHPMLPLILKRLPRHPPEALCLSHLLLLPLNHPPHRVQYLPKWPASLRYRRRCPRQFRPHFIPCKALRSHQVTAICHTKFQVRLQRPSQVPTLP